MIGIRRQFCKLHDCRALGNAQMSQDIHRQRLLGWIAAFQKLHCGRDHFSAIQPHPLHHSDSFLTRLPVV